MCVMNFDGRVKISQTSIPYQTDAITRRFFFTRDVTKTGRSIFYQMYVT